MIHSRFGSSLASAVAVLIVGLMGADSKKSRRLSGSVPEQLIMTWPCPSYTFPEQSMWTLRGFTAQGSPIWVNHGFGVDSHHGHYLFHDPSCDGSDGGVAAWLLAGSPPDSCLERDLDSDGTCSGHGAVGSADTSMPPSGNWLVYCCNDERADCGPSAEEVTFTVPSSFNTSDEINTYSPQALSLPCATNTEDCCGMVFDDDTFAKCDFWGDPHWANSFGHGQFSQQGLGAFQVAASQDGQFELQDMQCPWRYRETATVAVGVSIKVGGTRIGVHQNFLYVNGTKVTESTASLLDGLNVAGDARGGGVLIQSDDCCYRASVAVRIPRNQQSPGFFHNVQVRVLSDRAAGTGVCGVGSGYNTLVSSRSLLFDPAFMSDVCQHCTERPAQCDRTLASPEPTPIPPPADTTPEAFCAQSVSDEDCGADPLAQAQDACAALEGTDHHDGCMIDYCLSGCEEEMANLTLRERARTPPVSIELERPPVIPRDDDPGIAPPPPTPAPVTTTTTTRTTTTATSLTATDTSTTVSTFTATRTTTTRTTSTRTTTTTPGSTITTTRTSVTSTITATTGTSTRTTSTDTATTTTATTATATQSTATDTGTTTTTASTTTATDSTATSTGTTTTTASTTTATRSTATDTGTTSTATSATATNSTATDTATTATATNSTATDTGTTTTASTATATNSTTTASTETATSSTATDTNTTTTASTVTATNSTAIETDTETVSTTTAVPLSAAGGSGSTTTTTTFTGQMSIRLAAASDGPEAQANTVVAVVVLGISAAACCLLCLFGALRRRMKQDEQQNGVHHQNDDVSPALDVSEGPDMI